MTARLPSSRAVVVPSGRSTAGRLDLHGIPTAGADGLLVAAGVVAGLALGSASALLTRLELDGAGVPIARATLGAAAVWVLGIGGRMGFSLFMDHGGAPTVIRFSEAHHLTGPGWVTALVLMAFVEVVSRTLLLWVRSRSLTIAPSVGDPTPALVG